MMSLETKLGLLIGLVFVVIFGVLLNDKPMPIPSQYHLTFLVLAGWAFRYGAGLARAHCTE